MLTSYGLRTLAPGDTLYQGRYEGGPVQRDSAYHQGTVWPWLLGPFIRAYLKVYGKTPATIAQAEQWLAPLLDYCRGIGVGQIPEIFDGDSPRNGHGCFAQAWSVAEIARVYFEEVKGKNCLKVFSPL